MMKAVVTGTCRLWKSRNPASGVMMSTTSLDPEQILESLDRHIIGQMDAKRCVAVAFRNRFRRSLLSEELQREIMPANILMKGPTGVGKTEIARRVATLAQAPFIKVEATRYTEVGIVGANVSSMIKDMLEFAIAQERKRAMERFADRSQQQAEKEVLSLLKISDTSAASVRRLYNDLANDLIDVPLDVVRGGKRASSNGPIGIGIMGDAPDELISEISGLISSLGGRFGDGPPGSGSRRKTQRVPVKEALKLYQEYYSGQMVNEDDIIKAAKEATEQKGIVFIDEIGMCVCTYGYG
jgi:ATP-dependent HslUV protease ATP-binding subunit HslU